MSTATEKPSWATSGESLLNVPQTERSDDAGEPSEMKSGDRPSLTGRPLEHPGTMAGQDSSGSTASPEAPLVSDGKKAKPAADAAANVETDKSTSARK
jgi:hypothetical protein